jgi:hypothetical protein
VPWRTAVTVAFSPGLWLGSGASGDLQTQHALPDSRILVVDARPPPIGEQYAKHLWNRRLSSWRKGVLDERIAGMAESENAAPGAHPRKPNYDRWVGIIAILVGVIFFVLQSNGVEVSWVSSDSDSSLLFVP